MKHILALCALLVFGTSIAAAVPHKVEVVAQGPEATEVVSALKARINGTERYQIEDDHLTGDPEFFVRVICMNAEKFHLTGVICSYTFQYIPPNAPFISLVIGSSLGSNSEPEHAAERIFQDFVTLTPEANIQLLQSKLKASVGFFCNNPANGSVCRKGK